MTTGMFGQVTPRPVAPPVEVRIVVERGWGERPLTAPWEANTATEYAVLRDDLFTPTVALWIIIGCGFFLLAGGA